MPRTVRASFSPPGEVIEKRSPTPSSCSFAQPSSTIAPSVPRPVSTESSPSAQSNVNRPPTVFGSTEFRTSLSPNASAPSWRIDVTPCTPGVPASAWATAGSVGDQPSAPVTTWVALTRRSSEPVVESRRPWATTVTRVTSATPIIIAEAVMAVRPGLRIALRRASRPAEPPMRSATRPITEASRRTPRAGRRTFSEPGAASRRAATGGTRVARHAGTRPASRVTTRADEQGDDHRAGGEHHARLRQVHVHRGEHGVQALGDAEAGARARSARRARRSPAPRSARSESTCRRAAPTIRSSPNSRERWATVIESVLKIVNAPTRTATKPNTIRTIVMIPMNIFSPSRVKRSCALAVCTCAASRARRRSPCGRPRPGCRPCRRRGSSRSGRPCRTGPARCAGRTRRRSPRRATSRCRSARRRRRRSPSWCRARRCGTRRADAVVLLAGGRGVDDDLAGAGGPAARVEPERGGALGGLACAESKPTPKYGPSPAGLPSRAMIFASSWMSPTAAATCGTERTRSSSEASTVGRRTV